MAAEYKNFFRCSFDFAPRLCFLCLCDDSVAVMTVLALLSGYIHTALFHLRWSQEKDFESILIVSEYMRKDLWWLRTIFHCTRSKTHIRYSIVRTNFFVQLQGMATYLKIHVNTYPENCICLCFLFHMQTLHCQNRGKNSQYPFDFAPNLHFLKIFATRVASVTTLLALLSCYQVTTSSAVFTWWKAQKSY